MNVSLSRFKFPLLAAALLLSVSLRGEARPLVATLHPLLSEMVERLAGDAVRVKSLVPPTADIHSFDPSPRDLADIQGAKLVVAMGKHLEHYLDRLDENLPDSARIFEAGRRVPSVKIDPSNEVFACCPVHTHGAIDPHWWHSPLAMRRAVRYLGRELEELVPAERDAIRERTRRVMDEMEALHDWAQTELAALPKPRRKLVTAHAAFGYFCQEYDFQAIPVKGLTAERNPSPEDLAETVKTLRERNVRAVFPETKASDAILQSLKESTGVRLADPLYADFLSTDKSYEEMFRGNVANILAALRPAETE